MRKSHIFVLAVVGAIATVIFAGCSEYAADSCETYNSCAVADASVGSDGDAAGDASSNDCGVACAAPANGTATCVNKVCGISCDAGYHACNGACLSDDADDLSADACLVSDALGIFVTANGSGTGTQESPLGSIAAAMALGKSTGKPRVFVCGATPFTTPVSINAAQDGVTVYGGFTDCPSTGSWTWASSARTSVAPATPAAAITITGTATGVTFKNFSFTAKDGPMTAPGTSSVAVTATNAGAVTFDQCVISAGAGVSGAGGTTPTTAIPASLKGNDADASSNAGGSATAALTCPNGTPSVGASGGVGAPATGTPTDGNNGQPILTTNKGSASGGGAASCVSGRVGGNGGPGVDAPSPTSVLTLANNLLVPSAGAGGGYGGTAQGGGGGGGGFGVIAPNGNGGGGGGSGGCGGAGGAGGGGGGSSIGILAVQSPVTLRGSVIRTAVAGAGGAGASGQLGALGNLHGNSPSSGCPGGDGGTGGKGGAGAGGSGGVSVGIAYRGAAPTLDTATQGAVTLGAAGAKGAGGKPGVNDGLAGSSAATFVIP